MEPAGATSFGVTVDVRLHDNIQAEFLYSRQGTALTLFGRSGGVTDLGDANIDVYHGGVAFMLLDPEDRFRPFIALTVGATSFSPDEGESVTRFSGGFGFGVKAYFSDHIGLRAELRGYTVRFDLSETGLECGGIPCQFGPKIFAQGDANVGLIIGF